MKLKFISVFAPIESLRFVKALEGIKVYSDILREAGATLKFNGGVL